MAMCIHSQEFETCSFGCTFRDSKELKLENDELKRTVREMKKRENCRDRDCEFLKHGTCVVDECVWQLTKAEENYEQAVANNHD